MAGGSHARSLTVLPLPMLPLPMLLVTSLAAAGGWGRPEAVAPAVVVPDVVARDVVAPVALSGDTVVESSGRLSLPAAAILHECAAGSGGSPQHWVLPCGVVARTLGVRGLSFSVPAGQPRPERGVAVAPGGFLHLDLIDARHFGAGPEVSWVLANTPHEDLLRQRLVTPGVGVWYSPLPSRLFLGISANTRVSTLGETWFVNALSSEARVGFSL